MMSMNRNLLWLRAGLSLLGCGALMGAVPALMTSAAADGIATSPTQPRVAQVAPEKAKPLALTVLAEDGVKSEKPNVGVLSVGTIDLLTTSTIEHNFTLRNDNKEPVTITRLQATCGCTSVLLGEAQETSKTLAPGEQVKVRAAVDVTRFHGTIHKSVRAIGTSETMPLATMTISAVLKDPITFSTSQIDFGRVQAGSARSIPLTVTAHPSLVRNGNLPKLMSSNSDIQITAIAPGKVPTEGSTAPHVARYNVTIGAKAPIGPINGIISFSSLSRPETTTDEPQLDRAKLDLALQRASVPIFGEVAGRIAANPAMVVFGTNGTSKQRVILSSSTPAALQNLKVKSLNPLVVARLVAPTQAPKAQAPKVKVSATGGTKSTAKAPTSLPTAVILELSLSPNAPTGSLDSQVIITNAAGDRLNLPVSAYIEPALPAQ